MDNADVTVPFQAASQTVTDIQARTIRPDGSVLRVRPADIHVTSPNSDFTLYDDARNQPWLEVSTWPAWQSIAQWYQKLAGPQIAPSPEVTVLARRLTAGKRTEQDKARALFYWVETHTRYVALEQGLSAYRPHAAAAVCRNRYGDCKDMATLLITMLRAAGVSSAWPALLDTESALPLHTHLAVPDTFDHVIVRAELDGEPFWFDATAQYCSFGDIPGDDRGLEAFVVRGGVGRFETIPRGGPEANHTVMQKVVTLHADGSAECRATVRGEGDAALQVREQMDELRPNELPDHFQTLVGSEPDATLQHYALSACANPAVPLTCSVQYSSPAWATRTAGLLIISDGFAFHDPAHLRARRTPFCVSGGQQIVSNVHITLPPGYAPEALPDPVQTQTPLGTVSATWTAAAGTLTMHKVLTLVPATVSAAAYPGVRAQWEQAAALLRQPIVLRRSPAQIIALLPQK